jgi:geranylgeranyl diphosphate synthase type II
MAFEILADKGRSADDRCTLRWLQIIHIIGRAAGPQGMVEGQAMDLAFEGRPLDQTQLEAMHSLKTGALIRAAVISGGLIGNADETQIDQLNIYAERIGLAFQVMDDILNITGDPEMMGKAVGTDSKRQKNTYPALMGIDRAREYAAGLINEGLRAISPFDKKADPLRAIARYIVDRQR